MFKRLNNLKDQQRLVRMSLGLIFLVMTLMWFMDPFRTLIIVVAAYLLVTGIVGYCPITEVLMDSGSRTKRPAVHRSHKKSRRK